MANKNTAAAFAVFPEGQNVKWVSSKDQQTYVGKIVGWNDEKQKFHVEKKDGTKVFLPEDKLKKSQGRPALTAEQKANKEKEKAAAKTQTSSEKKTGKAPAKQEESGFDSSEYEAVELSVENFAQIHAAMTRMKELVEENNAEIAARQEQNEAIIETFGDILKGLGDHIAALESEEVEEPSDEEEPEETPAPAKKKVSSLLKKPMTVAAGDSDEE